MFADDEVELIREAQGRLERAEALQKTERLERWKEEVDEAIKNCVHMTYGFSPSTYPPDFQAKRDKQLRAQYGEKWYRYFDWNGRVRWFCTQCDFPR
jgi:hypothetical protein